MTSARSVRAGRAYVEVGAVDKTQATLRAIQDRIHAFGASIQAAGFKIAALGGAIIAPLSLAAKSFADTGDMLGKMSARTGVSAQALAAMGFAAEQSGSDLQTVEKGLKGITSAVYDAERGSSESVAAFDALGLSVSDLAGLSPEEQFTRTAEALAEVADESRKGALAQKLFGRAGRQLLPLFKAGAGGLRDMMEEAKRLGIVMSDEDVKAAEAFADAMNRVKRAIGGIVVRIGSALSGALEKVSNLFASQISVVSDWVNKNRGVIQVVGGVGAALVALGSALVVVGGAIKLIAVPFKLLSSAIGVVVSVASSLLSPLGLIAIAVAGLGAYFVSSSDTAKENLLGIKDAAVTTFQGITAALAKGDLLAAWEILSEGFKTVWQTTLNFMKEAWREFRDYIIDGVEVAAEKGASFAQGVIDGIIPFWDPFGGPEGEAARNDMQSSVQSRILAREKERKRLIEEQNKALAEQRKKLNALVQSAVDNPSTKQLEEAKRAATEVATLASGVALGVPGMVPFGMTEQIQKLKFRIQQGADEAGKETSTTRGATLSSAAKLLTGNSVQNQQQQILKNQQQIQGRMEKHLSRIERNTKDTGGSLSFA